ncbi:substrate import-associated zinc metallohydrolase lipoprotein [Sphingobacterium sp.]|uniref:substrate import-associated zinc metallohydrolase lipoprotein n=1 Tax=Sphingobacterium sp. TaxID=341027 RepID=UPI00258FEEA8|nr:substrate import-associated zinc metallohydrolase lipoprotein [Sphingobacterium sp.]WET71461.1 MAG: putative zinc-binding metallopeptidase [Sphingobacterium sp.]
MKILSKILILFLAIFLYSSCQKEVVKKVDFSNYNDDDPQTNTELDAWLKTTFLDEYNIDVVYRYNRYYHDAERNVTPIYVDKVKPAMTAVLESYILPYRKVAGETFIKRYVPKEWVLFGSPSLATDGTGVAGTAAAGRRVTLYSLNTQSPNFGVLVIHHEFTHILNQLVAIPTDFESISKADYNADWAKIPADTAKKYGFVTSYAMGKYTEDYAEVAAHLLVKGQAWYDNYASGSSTLGKTKLKQKEANVVNYFTTGLKVDFRALQKEVQEYMKRTAPTDNSLSIRPYVSSLYKAVTMNLSNAYYTKYGTSSAFSSAYSALRTGLSASNRTLNSISVRFDSSTQATIRVNYTSASGTFDADFTFSYTYDKSTGDLKLTKADQAGTTGNYQNANNIAGAFNSSLLTYFSNKVFTASWLNANVDPVDYNNLGAFYEKDNATNYWYGTLGQTL